MTITVAPWIDAARPRRESRLREDYPAFRDAFTDHAGFLTDADDRPLLAGRAMSVRGPGAARAGECLPSGSDPVA